MTGVVNFPHTNIPLNTHTVFYLYEINLIPFSLTIAYIFEMYLMIYLTTTINLSQVVMYNQLYSRKKIQNYVAVKT